MPWPGEIYRKLPWRASLTCLSMLKLAGHIDNQGYMWTSDGKWAYLIVMYKWFNHIDLPQRQCKVQFGILNWKRAWTFYFKFLTFCSSEMDGWWYKFAVETLASMGFGFLPRRCKKPQVNGREKIEKEGKFEVTKTFLVTTLILIHYFIFVFTKKPLWSSCIDRQSIILLYLHLSPTLFW